MIKYTEFSKFVDKGGMVVTLLKIERFVKGHAKGYRVTYCLGEHTATCGLQEFKRRFKEVE